MKIVTFVFQKSIFIFILALLIASFAASNVQAREADYTPHFATFRSNKINMRTGPSLDYPIKYTYQARGLPVEIIDEYENWYKVRDIDNTKGWVNKNLITKRRTVIILDDVAVMYKSNKNQRRPIYRLEKGVMAGLEECEGKWCEIKIAGEKGWIGRDSIWGVYDYENGEE